MAIANSFLPSRDKKRHQKQMTVVNPTNFDQIAISQNEAIRDYLNHYINLKTPPQFAVLLTGKWGSGKSWFVRDFLKRKFGEENRAGKNYLYVSLYGMTSFIEIETEFFRQLHPLLSSKGMKFASKLVSGLLRVSWNFDFDGDGRPEGKVSGNIPSQSSLSQPEHALERLIIFDDVERCSIPVPTLLGYINQLVEQNDMRVILVGNENEMLKKAQVEKKAEYPGEEHDDDVGARDPEYQRVKEKLIGQTFKVMPIVDKAFESFYNELPDGWGKRIVKDNSDEIKKIYFASELENLRLLRCSLIEFCRFAAELSEELIKNRDLAREVISEYICFDILLRSGEFRASELGLFGIRGRFGKTAGLKIKKDGQADLWRSRLPWISHFSPLLDSSLWQAVLSGGPWPLDSIHEALRNSRHFAHATTPNWVQLWHGSHALSDDEFSRLLNRVMQEWDRKLYDHEGVVLHVFGMLLECGKANMHDRSVADLISEAEQYILYLKERDQLVLSEEEIHWQTRDSYAQLQFQSLNSEAFKKIQKFLDTEKRKKAEEAMPNKAEVLLGKLQTGGNTSDFYESLTVGSHGSGSYSGKPILALINPADYVQAVSNLYGRDLMNVVATFKDRYHGNSKVSELVSERKWLDDTKALLEKLANSRLGTNSARLINLALLPRIDEAIHMLSATSEKAGSVS